MNYEEAAQRGGGASGLQAGDEQRNNGITLTIKPPSAAEYCLFWQCFVTPGTEQTWNHETGLFQRTYGEHVT